MNAITAKDWLDLLPIVADRRWRFVGPWIRDQDGCCPICALANEVAGTTISITGAYFASARVLGDSSGVMDIVHAADSSFSPFRPALMQALGMTK